MSSFDFASFGQVTNFPPTLSQMIFTVVLEEVVNVFWVFFKRNKKMDRGPGCFGNTHAPLKLSAIFPLFTKYNRRGSTLRMDTCLKGATVGEDTFLPHGNFGTAKKVFTLNIFFLREIN